VSASPRRPAKRVTRRRRVVTPGRLLSALAVAVAFVLGIGLGEALHESPSPAGDLTIVRTLAPAPLVPITRETVTVTTSKP
jgi:hypothetical protein